MPQTRFVTQKAFQMGFKPIVVINKVDRPGARPDWVLEPDVRSVRSPRRDRRTARFHDRLRFRAERLCGPDSPDVREGNMDPLFETIIQHVHAPPVDPDGPFQMRISQLDYNNYVGIIGIGRIQRGKVRTNMPVTIVDREGKKRNGRGAAGARLHGPRAPRSARGAGRRHHRDQRHRSARHLRHVCAPGTPSKQLPVLTVDEPTISMTFQVNNSPFAGDKEFTGRQVPDEPPAARSPDARSSCTTSR